MVFNNQIYLWKKIRGLQLGAVSIINHKSSWVKHSLVHVLLKMDIRKFFAIEGPKMESIAFEERWNFFCCY